MIELIFSIGLIAIVAIGFYLMRSTQDYIDCRNREYLNTINKVKPKVKKWV